MSNVATRIIVIAIVYVCQHIHTAEFLSSKCNVHNALCNFKFHLVAMSLPGIELVAFYSLLYFYTFIIIKLYQVLFSRYVLYEFKRLYVCIFRHQKC